MKRMECPNCGRRAFDISRLPNKEIEISLKCPQCKKIVTVVCIKNSDSLLDRSSLEVSSSI